MIGYVSVGRMGYDEVSIVLVKAEQTTQTDDSSKLQTTIRGQASAVGMIFDSSARSLVRCGRLSSLPALWGLAIVLAASLMTGHARAIADTRSIELTASNSYGAASTPPQFIFARIDRADTSPRRVQVDDVVFEFPRNARDIVHDLVGPQDGVSLRILYPSMSGWTRETARELDIIGQESRALQILISGVARYRSGGVDEMMSRVLHNRLLDEENESDHATAWADLERKSNCGGMTEYIVGPNSDKAGFRRSEMFRTGARTLARLDGNVVKSVIDCTGPTRVPNPGCSLHFSYERILVKASFRLALMSECAYIQPTFTKWLDAHRR